MDTTERMEAKLDAVLNAVAKLEQVLTQKKQPGFTIAAAARQTGLSESTIRRKLEAGELYRVKGRIPFSLIAPYLS